MALLKGSSLVETLVAAVIFLSVFFASIEMLARITVADEAAMDVVVAELQMRRMFDGYADAPSGTSHTQEFPWGDITVSVERYGESRRLNVVNVCARIKCGGRVLQYRRIVEYEE